MEIEFVKYNRGRLPEYRTETSIVKDGKGRYVRKRPLGPDAKGHVASLISKFDILQGLEGVKAKRPQLQGDTAVIEYVEGESFENRMLDRLSCGDVDGFRSLMDRFTSLLRSYGPKKTAEFRPGAELSKLLPEGFVLKDEPCLPITNMDLTFDNLIIDKEDMVWVTDYEWISDEPVPFSFIVFRSLYVFNLRTSERSIRLKDEELMALAGVDTALHGTYKEACERFVDGVFGDERRYLVSPRYRQKVHTLGPGEELDESTARLKQLREELESAYEMLRTRGGEVSKLHLMLSEMEASVKRKEAEIVLLTKSLKQQSDHVSFLDEKITFLSGENAELALKLSRADHQIWYFEDRIFAINGLLAETEEKAEMLATQAEADRKRLLLYKDEVEKLYVMFSDLRAIIDMDQASYKELSEQIERKQKELMTMSDWAYGMKQRLEFIDSSPSVIRAERRARNIREAKAMFKANGFSGLFKGFLRRYRPGWAAHGHVHEVPADVEELAMNVRTNRGKLLVVFPIIPWEFRWQRPQQLVSRFAKDGCSVLFVNMSLTPKGRRFKDDKDAGKDVKIGKLDDNIYQVWLSSENRMNVYQDRMSEGDVSNLLNGLRFVLEDVDASSILYTVQFPGWADLAIALRKKVKGKLVFDSMDEHSGFSNNAEAVLRDEEKLLRQSDLVITTSSKLQTKALMHSEDVVMVRNGTDFEFFNKLEKNGELDAIKGPIVGYYGAISDWFDADIIDSCARSHPEWTFVLIGSTVGSKVDALEKLPNVKFLGEKPYKNLPGFLAYFDVCIIPFKINQLTLATNPVKFYEYLSSGKPVVSVPLPELMEFKDLCYLADGAKEFEESIGKALKEDDKEIVSRRIAFAKENSWDDRYRRIKRALDDI